MAGVLRGLIASYQPFNEQEAVDQKRMLAMMDAETDLLTRANPNAHFTASAWIVSPDRKQVLMAYHNIYQSWSWLGGHADGEEDLMQVAAREVQEESGLTTCKPVDDGIYSLEVLTVQGHEKRGVYVGSHLHLNVTYLFEADPNDPLTVKPDENAGLAWFDVSKVLDQISLEERWMGERIYRKLIEKGSTVWG